MNLKPVNLFLMSLVLMNLVATDLPAQARTSPGTEIADLRVQGCTNPLAVEDKNPLFSWLMISQVTGQKQSAYQIVVTREDEKSIVWNSGKTISDISGDIRYNGKDLEPETAYSWDLTIWDAKGKSYSRSRFETGIMNPRIDGWNGAEWIGSNQLLLDAVSAYLFEINTDFQIMPGSKTVSLIFGANDFRLNDRIIRLAGNG